MAEPTKTDAADAAQADTPVAETGATPAAETPQAAVPSAEGAAVPAAEGAAPAAPAKAVKAKKGKKEAGAASEEKKPEKLSLDPSSVVEQFLIIKAKGILDLLDIAPDLWDALRAQTPQGFELQIAGYGPLETVV